MKRYIHGTPGLEFSGGTWIRYIHMEKTIQVLTEIKEYTHTDHFADNAIDAAHDIAERIDKLLQEIDEYD